jgi:hypothetical protein
MHRGVRGTVEDHSERPIVVMVQKQYDSTPKIWIGQLRSRQNEMPGQRAVHAGQPRGVIRGHIGWKLGHVSIMPVHAK